MRSLRRGIATLCIALALVIVAGSTSASASLAQVPLNASSTQAPVTLADDGCGSLYTLTRLNRTTVRVNASSSAVRAAWGNGRYGVTRVWNSSNGSLGQFIGDYNTSSTGGANFQVTSVYKWWTLALVDNSGYEWCRGLYYK